MKFDGFWEWRGGLIHHDRHAHIFEAGRSGDPFEISADDFVALYQDYDVMIYHTHKEKSMCGGKIKNIGEPLICLCLDHKGWLFRQC
jgi:hypothetical protein